MTIVVHQLEGVHQDACFPVRSMTRTLPEIEASALQMDSSLERGSAACNTAVILLAALDVGQNVDRLARFTGVGRSHVARCTRRLVDNGVWSGGVTVSSWVHDRNQVEAFRSDVAVGEGRLCRRIGEDGQAEWAPQGYWRKHYEYVAPRAAPANDAICYHPHVAAVSQPLPYIPQADEKPEEEQRVPAFDPWLRDVPASVTETAVPVWLGATDVLDEEISEQLPAVVGTAAPEMFPGAVWLG